MPVAPSRSHQQRNDALVKANDIRVRRAALKRTLTFDRAVEVVAEPPPWAAAMKALDLLVALPRIGKIKARETLRACQISDSKTVGGLSDRQRSVLVAAIGLRSRPKRSGESGQPESPARPPHGASVAERASEQARRNGRDAH